MEFKDVFEPIPHVEKLPKDIQACINLKDASKTIATRTYTCPCKFREAWKTLIQQHLNAGRIRPSSSAYASPAFIIPKRDPKVLLRWVNDYRQLNVNTVTDCHPLPRVDDILADCAKGKIWSVINMTNSFFPDTDERIGHSSNRHNDAIGFIPVGGDADGIEKYATDIPTTGDSSTEVVYWKDMPHLSG
jgi:hypothetical protein